MFERYNFFSFYAILSFDIFYQFCKSSKDSKHFERMLRIIKGSLQIAIEEMRPKIIYINIYICIQVGNLKTARKATGFQACLLAEVPRLGVCKHCLVLRVLFVELFYILFEG